MEKEGLGFQRQREASAVAGGSRRVSIIVGRMHGKGGYLSHTWALWICWIRSEVVGRSEYTQDPYGWLYDGGTRCPPHE